MISPLAYVDPKAEIGNNVTIHPFAYIDKNVVIGDNCEIFPYASVLAGTTMGKTIAYSTVPYSVPSHKISDTKVKLRACLSATTI